MQVKRPICETQLEARLCVARDQGQNEFTNAGGFLWIEIKMKVNETFLRLAPPFLRIRFASSSYEDSAILGASLSLYGRRLNSRQHSTAGWIGLELHVEF